MQPEEGDRQPIGRQHLDVPHLGRPIGAESERHARQERRVVTARQDSGEQIRAKGRERPREEERRVVRRKRIVRQPEHGARDDAEADEIFGEAADPVTGVEIRCVPPRVGKRPRGRVPPQNRRVENGIVRVVRNPRGAELEQRARIHRGQQQIDDEDADFRQPAWTPDRRAGYVHRRRTLATESVQDHTSPAWLSL